MSNDAGDTTSRLSDALDDILPRGGADETELAADDDGDPAGGEPYELPEIVSATEETASAPVATEPTVEEPAAEPALPARPPVGATATSTVTDPTVAESAASSPVPTTTWSDHMPTTAATVTTPTSGQLRAPGRRPRVRRVTRVLRHVDPWSTFKIALLFSGVAYVVALTSGVLLWRVADATGTLANIERWFTQFGWETFELEGGEIFRQAWIIGLFGVVFATGAAVLLVTLFNLVSDIVGGVRMTVLEEEVVERTISSTRRYVVRTPSSEAAVRRTTVPAWSVDDETAASDDTAAGDETAAGTAPDDQPGDDPARKGDDEVREQPAATWSVD